MTNEEIFEGYPDEVLARIEARDRLRKSNTPSYIDDIAVELVFEDLKLWQSGVLSVSFKGGTAQLHKAIADVASEWCTVANIQFDFGQNGIYRRWQPGDNSHIRVGFEYNGYWSLVGTDSRDITIAEPGEITLNLSGFDIQLPNSWKGTVLHEFGHALGFQHEHQSPYLTCDFDWEKLYDELAKSPNYWSRAKVDHNLKQLPGGGLTYGPHDRHSIMHYAFPDWMFKQGASSPCYTSRNETLSPEDRRMAARAYPADTKTQELIAERRISNLKVLNESVAAEAQPVKSHFEKHLAFLESSVR